MAGLTSPYLIEPTEDEIQREARSLAKENELTPLVFNTTVYTSAGKVDRGYCAQGFRESKYGYFAYVKCHWIRIINDFVDEV